MAFTPTRSVCDYSSGRSLFHYSNTANHRGPPTDTLQLVVWCRPAPFVIHIHFRSDCDSHLIHSCLSSTFFYVLLLLPIKIVSWSFRLCWTQMAFSPRVVRRMVLCNQSDTTIKLKSVEIEIISLKCMYWQLFENIVKVECNIVQSIKTKDSIYKLELEFWWLLISSLTNFPIPRGWCRIKMLMLADFLFSNTSVVKTTLQSCLSNGRTYVGQAWSVITIIRTIYDSKLHYWIHLIIINMIVFAFQF